MKRLLFFLLACCITTYTYAQNITVKGKVTDAADGPLIGAAIKVKGSSGGTSADNNGEFSISVPTGSSLLISFVGFEPKEVQVTSGGPLNIILSDSGNSLGEVVVVGYGTQKKATLTGSIASVSNAEISTTKTQNVQNMLTE
ncbi:carboxypeptidase-like regulatory domain-containing protein [Pedobacter panaciterrae]